MEDVVHTELQGDSVFQVFPVFFFDKIFSVTCTDAVNVGRTGSSLSAALEPDATHDFDWIIDVGRGLSAQDSLLYKRNELRRLQPPLRVVLRVTIRNKDSLSNISTHLRLGLKHNHKSYQ